MIKRILIVSIVIIVVITALFGVTAFFHSSDFRVKQVVIKGEFEPENQVQLQSIITPLVQKNLFELSVNQLQASIQKLPWVAEAEIRRAWPDKIVVNIISQLPVAIWNKSQILNAYGEVLDSGAFGVDKIGQLPQFFGPDDSVIKMLDYYQQMNRILRPAKLHVSTLNLNEDQTWQVVLDNGIMLHLGDEQILTRLQRFVKVYPKVLSTHKKQPNSIDLRYAHGMAVQW